MKPPRLTSLIDSLRDSQLPSKTFSSRTLCTIMSRKQQRNINVKKGKFLTTPMSTLTFYTSITWEARTLDPSKLIYLRINLLLWKVSGWNHLRCLPGKMLWRREIHRNHWKEINHSLAQNQSPSLWNEWSLSLTKRVRNNFRNLNNPLFRLKLRSLCLTHQSSKRVSLRKRDHRNSSLIVH